MKPVGREESDPDNGKCNEIEGLNVSSRREGDMNRNKGRPWMKSADFGIPSECEYVVTME